MAKTVMRVNGKNGENMSIEDGVVRFKSENVVYDKDVEDFSSFDIINVEEARELVDAKRDVVGLWTKDTQSTKGKTSLLVGAGKGFCWVMEINKTQSQNAISLARSICPSASEEDEELEYKLYAAIQTPKGALFTVGSIGCALGAYFVLGNLQQPLIALVLAGLSIFMFVNVK